MKPTLQDMRDILVTSSDGSDRHFWGVVTAKNTNSQGEVTSYEVSLGGSEGTMTCRKLAGADIGDTVMVTLTKTGMAVVTGTVDGDKDAADAMAAAEQVASDVDAVEDLVGDGDTSGITVTTMYYLSSSNITQTGGTWSENLPAYSDGHYYWKKTVTTYADGSEVETDPVLDTLSQLSAEADYLLASVNNHFWVDEDGGTGAYVSENNLSYASGYALRMASSGIAQMYNGKAMNTLTSSGLTYYQSDGATVMAQYTAGGCYLYGGGMLGALITSSGLTVYSVGSIAASFGAVTTIGNTNGTYWEFASDGLFWHHNGETEVSDIALTSTLNGGYTVVAQTVHGSRAVEGGAISGSSLSVTGTVSGTSLSATGAVSGASLSTTGAVTGSSLSISGSVTLSSTVAGNTVSAYNVGMGSSYRLGVYSSSKEKKTDISYEIEEEFNPHQLYDLPVVTFRWKDEYNDDGWYDKDRKQIGFIAEDVHDAYYVGAIHDTTGKTIDWSHRTIIPAMLKLVQEQHEQIDTLTAIVDELKRRN